VINGGCDLVCCVLTCIIALRPISPLVGIAAAVILEFVVVCPELADVSPVLLLNVGREIGVSCPPFAGTKAMTTNVPVVANEFIIEFDCTGLTGFQVFVMYEKGVLFVGEEANLIVPLIIEDLNSFLIGFIVIRISFVGSRASLVRFTTTSGEFRGACELFNIPNWWVGFEV
jgi:hypothetical protein